MRLTTFTDYALRVLIYVAAHPQARATIAETARAFDISEHHLTKVVQLLGREGFLTNVRGRGGGFVLARDPSLINVGAVVRATEQSVPAECFDAGSNRCVVTPVCRLKNVLGEAVASFYATLDHYTLADLVANRRAIARVMFAAPRA
ncbi:MAG: Rrf2 family transcriptional regulator [Burkholderiales bacterium]|nr:Rrf2 family transcriptional regulator [Burkholderiales bacterium]GIK87645.1 MAG: HTH-type transcriptional regulator NsrR [Betaproteobacteria bacterium]